MASASIGIDYETKIIKYKNKRYNITIQDTSGEERFRGLVKSYYHFSDGFFIFFDLTNEHTLSSVHSFIESIEEELVDPKIIILGTKDEESNEKKNS